MRTFARPDLNLSKLEVRALAEFQPDVVIVDGNRGRLNVPRVTRVAAQRHNSPFVILLTNHTDVPKDAMYDAYLVRPFTNRSLNKQILSLLETRSQYVLCLGPLVLDKRTRRVRTSQGVRQLTPKQSQLLSHLMEHAGQIVTRQALMKHIWETDYLGDTRTLDVHVRWLREQIEEDPNHPVLVRTHRGRGYSLDLPGPARPGDRKSTRLNSSHIPLSRMPSSA